MRVFLASVFALVASVSMVSCGARDDASQLKVVEKDSQNWDSLAKRGVEVPSEGRFPHTPRKESTPGSLCEKSETYRYPEHVKYCERNVDKEQKHERFVHYDKEYGFSTLEMERSEFKIDHLIPLCLGGSNNSDNLWPQHKVIYENTDPLEPFMCETLAAGKIKQAEAVRILLEIKQRPFDAPEELRKLESRF
jgi:hypothetical protein